MREDHFQFMSLLGQPPTRLTVEQTAWTLNCQPHDVPVLIAARLLKPLGNPAPNSIKFFATAEVLESAKDRAWLVRVTATINLHWQNKNKLKKGRLGLTRLTSSLAA
jgi:hypothetical protein